MTSVCIDTHVLVWHLSKPRRLGKRAARLLRQADAGRVGVIIPAIVLVELTLIREAGRNTVGVSEVEALLAAQPAFELGPFGLADAREFALLATVKDPFDRMILAAARARSSPLVTADAELHELALVETVWD